MRQVTQTTPLSGMIYHRQARTCYGQHMYQIWSLYLHPWRRNKRRCKMQNGVVCGGYGSLKIIGMSPFDTAHTTAYSTLIETMHLSCTVFICIWRPRTGWPWSNFPQIFGNRKRDSLGYHMALFAWTYMFSRFSRTSNLWRRDRRADRRRAMAYTALAHRRAIKKNW